MKVCCGAARRCYHFVLFRSLALVSKRVRQSPRLLNLCISAVSHPIWTCYHLEPPFSVGLSRCLLVQTPPTRCSQWKNSCQGQDNGGWSPEEGHLGPSAELSPLQDAQQKLLHLGIRNQPAEMGDSKWRDFSLVVSINPFPLISNTPFRNQGLVGGFTLLGTLESGISGMGLLGFLSALRWWSWLTHPWGWVERTVWTSFSLWLIWGSFPIATVSQPGISPVKIPAVGKGATSMMDILWILMHAFWMVWVLSSLASGGFVWTHVALFIIVSLSGHYLRQKSSRHVLKYWSTSPTRSRSRSFDPIELLTPGPSCRNSRRCVRNWKSQTLSPLWSRRALIPKAAVWCIVGTC